MRQSSSIEFPFSVVQSFMFLNDQSIEQMMACVTEFVDRTERNITTR